MKSLKTCLLCLILMVQAGCVNAFAYRHSDWLVLWKMDHYLDLTKDQKRQLRGRVKELLTEHRQEALPLYERFLNGIKEKSADGLTREDVDLIFAKYQDLRADLFRRVVPGAAAFLTSVNDGQLRNLEEAFQEDNQKAEREVKEERGVRMAKRASATLDWLKEWLGPLSGEQKRRITEISLALPDMHRTRFDFQQRRQQEVLDLLRATQDRQIISQRLRDWLVYPDRTNPPQYE